MGLCASVYSHIHFYNVIMWIAVKGGKIDPKGDTWIPPGKLELIGVGRVKTGKAEQTQKEKEKTDDNYQNVCHHSYTYVEN